MKKFFLLVVLFLLVPLNIKAAKISNAEIVSETNKKIGQTLEMDFNINFSELEKGYDKTFGIWVIGFKINFDEKILRPMSVFSEHFMSDIYIDTETQEYYILSEVIENSSNELNCADGLLYCGNYKLTIKFFIEKTEQQTTTVEMSNIEVGFLDITDDEKTYTFDDLIEINSNISKSKTINIKQTTEEIEAPKETITITQNKKENIINNVPEIKKEESKKSSNSLLKLIKIEGYNLEFDKDKKEYVLEIDSKINKLNLTIETEDNKAKYEVIGADDLNSNNNEILIEVTAEDNTKSTYKIKVIKNETIKEDVIEEKTSKENKISPKIFIYIGIILISLIIFIIIYSITNHKKNKNIDKYLDNL